jgi:hypothetical protein
LSLARIADLNQPPEALAQYFEIARSLSKMYDNLLATWEEDKGERPPGIHASEVAKCLRQAFYSCVSLEKRQVTEVNMRRRFHIGHAIHSMVQKELHKMAAHAQAEEIAQQNGWYLEFDDEVKVNPALQELAAKYNIWSSCDGVFTFRELEHGEVVLRIGLEIKSEAPDGYAKLNGPKEDHIDQVHIYMACLDLPLLWFFYMNKANQNTTPSHAPWLIPFDSKIWNRLEGRMQHVLTSVTDGIEPAREEGFHCGFCPYTWECQPTTTQQRNTGAPRPIVSVRRT